MLLLITSIADAEFLLGISLLSIKFYIWENKIHFRMIQLLMKFQVLPNNSKRKLSTEKKIRSSVSYKCKMTGQENGAFPTVQGKTSSLMVRMGESLKLMLKVR